jgi:hypothetical protein
MNIERLVKSVSLHLLPRGVRQKNSGFPGIKALAEYICIDKPGLTP